MDKFTIETIQDSRCFQTTVRLSGELGYGMSGPEVKSLNDSLKHHLKTVIINIEEVKYWDSLAMRALFLNLKDKTTVYFFHGWGDPIEALREWVGSDRLDKNSGEKIRRKYENK